VPKRVRHKRLDSGKYDLEHRQTTTQSFSGK
jgi:hypothetical protein